MTDPLSERSTATVSGPYPGWPVRLAPVLMPATYRCPEGHTVGQTGGAFICQECRELFATNQFTINEWTRPDTSFGCPGCGFGLHDILVGDPRGFAAGVARAITMGLPCCGYVPDNEQSKRWARAAAVLGEL